MDHFSNPRNVGQIDNANAVGEVGNAKCGDIASILEDKAGNIWLGTDGNGLYVKEKQKGLPFANYPSPT